MNGRSCFLVCLLFVLPLQILSVCSDEWFFRPPKPFSDGPDYEAVGFGLYQRQGWSTHFSDADWFAPYAREDAFRYARLSSRVGPVVPDTNRPPLLPTAIAIIYTIVPRGPMAFAAIRITLAVAIAIGVSLFALLGFRLLRNSTSDRLRRMAGWTPYAMVAIVYSERNLRNYMTDFLTEPYALLGIAAFMLLLWIAISRRSKRYLIFSSVTLSLTIYCRNSFLLATPVLFLLVPVLYTLEHQDRILRWREGIAWTLTLLGLALLLQTPWWIRNCYVLDSMRPLGTKGATTLLGGYCDASYEMGGEWQSAPELQLRSANPPPMPTDATKSWIENEKQISDLASAEVKRWSYANWRLLPTLIAKRIVTEWNPYRGKALLFKLLALLAIVMLWRSDRRTIFWISIPLLMTTFTAAITYSLGGRYLVPAYGSYYLLVFIGSLFIGDMVVHSVRAIHSKAIRSKYVKASHS